MEVQTESTVALVPSFCVASLLVYLSYGCSFLLPGGDPKESLLARAALPMLLLVAGLLITFRIAWRLRRPDSLEKSGRGLQITLPFSLLGVMSGALLAYAILAILMGRLF
jgi:hypothetical protein